MEISQNLQHLFQSAMSHPNTSKLGSLLWLFKNIILLMGATIMFMGAIVGLFRFLVLYFQSKKRENQLYDVNSIRRDFGNTIVLGLEFIIAADVIETTTIPDYYSLGILAVIVVIRTFLSYTLSKEIA